MYPPAPPVAALTAAAPFAPPKHATFVCDAAAKDNAGGCVTVNVCTAVQAFASVTVQVQVPAVNPVTDVVPSPVGLPGVQL